jgi:hypothetical protein
MSRYSVIFLVTKKGFEYTVFVRGVQTILITGLVLLSTLTQAKARFGVDTAMVSGYRDQHWESGVDLSLYLTSRFVDFRVRAPVYFTMTRHPAMDPYDWDQRSDYGRILDRMSAHTQNNKISLYIGSLRNITLGIGELVESFYNNLSHRTGRAGVLLRGDVDFVGGDVMVSNILDVPGLVAGRVFFRPMFSVGGIGRFFRIEAQLAMAGNDRSKNRYGFGIHAPVYANDRFGVGVEFFFRTGIYTLGLFSRWDIKDVKGRVQAGIRLSRHQVNTAWANPFFTVEQIDFWGLGSRGFVEGAYVVDKTKVAAMFLRFRLQVAHVTDLWLLVDADTTRTALYAGGIGLTLGPVRAGLSSAIRG